MIYYYYYAQQNLKIGSDICVAFDKIWSNTALDQTLPLAYKKKVKATKG